MFQIFEKKRECGHYSDGTSRFLVIRAHFCFMLRLRVGGVAEHYNLPWHLLRESDKLRQIGIEMVWQDCPGGTGEMTHLLRSNELDIAVLLTEGIIADKLKGGDSKILKVFVKSSLEWGVHVPENVETLAGPSQVSFAVSRMGSGSHYMASLYADKAGIPRRKLKFVEVGSLEGAMKAFDEKSVDAFLWERFTTEPYLERHDLKRIDSIYTPWPCFVVAIRPAIYAKHREEIEELLNEVLERAAILKQEPNAIEMIADRYALPIVRVAQWFEQVDWGSGENLSPTELETVVSSLKSLGGFSSEIEAFYSEKREPEAFLTA